MNGDWDWIFDYMDTIEDMNTLIVTTISVVLLDTIIADCKAEMERRKGILDELTQEAQELEIGY